MSFAHNNTTLYDSSAVRSKLLAMLRKACPEDVLTEDTIRYGYKDTAPDLNISEQNESTLTLLGTADAKPLSAGTVAAMRKVGSPWKLPRTIRSIKSAHN